MTVQLVSRAVVVLALLMLTASNWPREARAQGPDDLVALNTQVSQLYGQGKYREAILIAERAVALARERHGEEHEIFASAIYWLGTVYEAQSRYDEAEPLLKRALSIREKVLGPDHPDVGNSLNNLALLYKDQGRYAEAEPRYKRALAITEKALGPDHLDVATPLNNLAALNDIQGRYAEAEQFYKRALAIREKALDPDNLLVALSLNNLATLYTSQGRYAEAEQLFKRALAIREKTLGPDNTVVSVSLSNLATLYTIRGQYAEAEPLYKRVLVIREKALGPEHPLIATALSGLAILYRNQGRYAEAEPLYKRALTIDEKTLARGHVNMLVALNNLADLYRIQGRYSDAEPLYKQVLAVTEQVLGPTHPTIATYAHNLATLYRTQGHFAEAEALLERALAIAEKTAPDHPNTAKVLINLAELYREQGRYAEAETHSKQAFAIAEKALGPDHPDVASAFNTLAWLALARRDWVQAADYWQRATEVIERRSALGLAGSEESSVRGEAVRNSSYFSGLVKMTELLARKDNADGTTRGLKTFETAQWAVASDAASALAQMAARGAKGSPELARIVRERQDLIGERQVKDKQLISAKSEPLAKRNLDRERLLSDRLANIDVKLSQISSLLAKDFPEYTLLVTPKPISVTDVQGELRDGEALILMLDTSEFKPVTEATFVWVLTKSDMRWVRSELGTSALHREVAALRCGLDFTLWDNVESATKCKDALRAEPRGEAVKRNGKEERNQVLPFDLARAHVLYKALLAPIEDMIKGKRLLIVPSGPLTSLPFNVLVTEPPEIAIPQTLAQYRNVAWLGARTALTVLPSVSSLKVLRQFAKTSHASKIYLGIGNPLLDGAQDDPVWGADNKKRAELARTKRCTQAPRVALAHGRQRSVRSFTSMFRGIQADIEQIRYQAPLPESADELCEVARQIGVSESEVLLGANATEARLKDLSDKGRLADYQILHFATHGALAGQVEGLAEPGLILTPPTKRTSDPKALERDDGFLTASEIASLKLDADWVILSACNTAGAQGEGAEALSGMARAFLYAGARALLVSHWEVDTDAAIKLTTRAFAELKAHPAAGRAEAMRFAMRELIERGSPAEVHPSMWAPFVVVGEGAAR